jgi:ERCC4-related helicase
VYLSYLLIEFPPVIATAVAEEGLDLPVCVALLLFA